MEHLHWSPAARSNAPDSFAVGLGMWNDRFETESLMVSRKSEASTDDRGVLDTNFVWIKQTVREALFRKI